MRRLHLKTDAERERLYAARERGGVCAGCGRALEDGEPVYIESIALDLKPLTAPGTRRVRSTVSRDAPLGAECASPGLLARMADATPDPCMGCGRPIFYALDRAGRQQAMCSKRCAFRAKRST